MKVFVSDIEWEYYEGDEEEEPECDCPCAVELVIECPNDVSEDDLDRMIYDKLIDEVGDGWILDYGNWNVERI